MSSLVLLLALAQVPYRVADLEPTPDTPVSSSPSGIVDTGPIAFFYAYDGPNGTELWRTDGTDAGTFLVRDLTPGSTSSTSDPLGVVDAGLVVMRTDLGLYTSDGTAAGTVRVCCGTLRVLRFALLPGGGIVFAEQASASRLYKVDSSPEGASVLANINVTEFLGVVGQRLLFYGRTNPVSGLPLLWATDGTAAGTVSLATMSQLSTRPATVSTGTYAWVFSGGVATLMRTDGTSAGTQTLGAFPGTFVSSNLVASGDRLFYAATTAATGQELFTASGLPNDFPVFAEVRDGGSAALGSVTAFNGGVLVSASIGSPGIEPWFIGGDAGVVSLGDINPGSSSSPTFSPHGARALFTCNHTQPIWVTDGTLAGTVALTASAAGAAAFSAAPLGSGWMFSLRPSGSGVSDPYLTDGTPAGTRLLKRISERGTGSSFPYDFTAFDNKLQFIGYSPVVGNELHQLDVIDGGISVLGDLFPTNLGGAWRVLGQAGGRLFLAGETPTTGRELFASRGVPGDLTLVKDIYPGPTNSRPGYSPFGPFQGGVTAGGLIYFAAETPFEAVELWQSDGTTAGTKLIRDHNPFGDGDPYALTALADGGLVFAAQDDYLEYDTLRLGDDGGFVRLHGDYPTMAVRVGDFVYLDLTDTAAGWELFVTDGTPAGTRLAADVLPGPANGAPEQLTAQGGRLFFFARDAVDDLALFKLDDAGIVAERLLTLGPRTGVVYSNLYAGANGVFFSLFTPDAGSEPYFSDGTRAAMLADLIPGLESSEPEAFVPAGGKTYFTAADQTHGRELWVTNGTAAGTRMVYDIVPGPGSSDPEGLFTAYGWLFFSAGDSYGDFEPWALPLTERPPDIVARLTGQTGGDGGWFVSDVGVTFTVTDPIVPILTASGCGTARMDIDGGFVGSTVVTQDGPDTQLPCSARSSGGTSSVTVSVRRDATAPRVTCPPTVVAAAATVAGAPVSFPVPVAVDQIDPAPAITSSHASGSTFTLGRTVVTVTATDHVGHVSECTFAVEVRDGTPPVLTCPQMELTAMAGMPLDYSATATDGIDPAPMVMYSAPPGTVFPPGRSGVSVTAIDAAGNLAACTFFVTVEGTVDGGGGGEVNGSCGCTSAPWSLGLLALLALGRRRRR